MKPRSKTQNFYLVVALVILLTGTSMPSAYGQNLDDAIDAELDDVSGGLNPSTNRSTNPSTGSSSAPKSDSGLDDVQLDDGGDSAPVEKSVAAKKSPAPKAEKPPESDFSSDLAPLDGEPAPAIVQDELGLEEQPAQSAEQKPSAPSDSKREAPLDSGDGSFADEPTQVTEDPAPVVDVPGDLPAPQAPAVSTPVARASDVNMDAPNAAYEKRLGRISSGYKVVPDINWDEIVGERRQENYGLQSGDTLWDISDTFFGDGFFWAKLWSQNGVIENPHMIVRGKGIRFVAGTEGEAPAIGVMDVRVASNSEVISLNPLREKQEAVAPTYREEAQADVSQEELENGIVLETDELIPAPQLPPPSLRAPLLKELPSSFAEKRVYLDNNFDATGLDAPPVINAKKAASIFVNSFMSDRAPEALGKIDEIEAQEQVASVGQTVFVRLNREVEMGSRVSFLKSRGSPKHSGGVVVDVLGIGVIDGVIKDSGNVYRATVTTALQPVEKGAIVSATAPPRVTVDRNGRRGESRVKVIGGEFDNSRSVLGTGSVIYLSGGAAAGLQKNDVMGIESMRGSRRETKYPDVKHAIAVIKIADVQNQVATAIVLNSFEEIAVGDMTSGDLPTGSGGLEFETADQAAAGFGRKAPVDIP